MIALDKCNDRSRAQSRGARLRPLLRASLRLGRLLLILPRLARQNILHRGLRSHPILHHLELLRVHALDHLRHTPRHEHRHQHHQHHRVLEHGHRGRRRPRLEVLGGGEGLEPKGIGARELVGVLRVLSLDLAVGENLEPDGGKGVAEGEGVEEVNPGGNVEEHERAVGSRAGRDLLPAVEDDGDLDVGHARASHAARVDDAVDVEVLGGDDLAVVHGLELAVEGRGRESAVSDDLGHSPRGPREPHGWGRRGAGRRRTRRRSRCSRTRSASPRGRAWCGMTFWTRAVHVPGGVAPGGDRDPQNFFEGRVLKFGTCRTVEYRPRLRHY